MAAGAANIDCGCEPAIGADSETLQLSCLAGEGERACGGDRNRRCNRADVDPGSRRPQPDRIAVYTNQRPAGGNHHVGGILIHDRCAFLALARAAGDRTCSEFMKRIYVASSNRGKLRDFIGAAQGRVEILPVPELSSLPPVEEDGATFEENARKKAEYYSRIVPGEIVLADDSGLEVEALGGAPGIHSARY